jgi:hypothetical protein
LVEGYEGCTAAVETRRILLRLHGAKYLTTVTTGVKAIWKYNGFSCGSHGETLL